MEVIASAHQVVLLQGQLSVAVHAPCVRVYVNLGDLIVRVLAIVTHKLLNLSALRGVSPIDTPTSAHHGLSVIRIQAGLILME